MAGRYDARVATLLNTFPNISPRKRQGGVLIFIFPPVGVSYRKDDKKSEE